MKDLKLFHYNNGYYIKVIKLPHSIGCSVEFPKNLLLDKEHYSKIYIIDEKRSVIEIHNLNNLKNEYKEVSAPIYATRILIAEDIVVSGQALNMTTDLILVFEDDHFRYDLGLFDILDVKLTKEEEEKEKLLCNIFSKILTNQSWEDVDLEDEEVLDVCDLIVTCFENGGL